MSGSASSFLPTCPDVQGEQCQQQPKSSPNGPRDADASDSGWVNNGLRIAGPSYRQEDIYHYQPGGYHPVHLGDLYKDGRYRVMHKLGYGGFATIWLCLDTTSEQTKYVALKILMAYASTETCAELSGVRLGQRDEVQEDLGTLLSLPLDHFRIEGPNGSHLCFVYPVLGPRVSHVPKDFGNLERTLRKICRQIVQGVAALHRAGICHGDLTCANVLLRLEGLDGSSVEEVMANLGAPRCASVERIEGKSHVDPQAPQYLVEPLNFNRVGLEFVTDQACITDFGEVFALSEPPADLGIPSSHLAPEMMFSAEEGGGAPGVATDLWALGCTLFEIRTGRKLFPTYDNNGTEVLYQMVLLLGRLPERLWESWEDSGEFFQEGEDEKGNVLENERMVEEREMKVGDAGPHASTAPGARSIAEKVRAGLWYFNEYLVELHQEIGEEEIGVFADLLGGLLKYRPEERMAAEAVLQHRWFRM